MSYSMRFFVLLLTTVIYTRGALADDSQVPQLIPPNPKDVVRVENMPNHAPVYIYSSGEMKFVCSKDEILHFLAQGKAHPVDFGGDLWNLAPFTPPRKLAEEEKAKLYEAVATGALSTRDGAIYFWRKLNDRVLYLGQHDSACYLILPEPKP